MSSIMDEGSGPGGPGPARCLLLLQRSLAIQLTRGPPPQVLSSAQHDTCKEHPADEMWMYDKGYNLFQVSPLSSLPGLFLFAPPRATAVESRSGDLLPPARFIHHSDRYLFRSARLTDVCGFTLYSLRIMPL